MTEEAKKDAGRTEQAGHTPGPWGWRHNGDEWYLVREGSGDLVVLCTVAELDHFGALKERLAVRVDRPEPVLVPLTPTHPDAMLIGAAPTLLEALEDLLRRFGYTDWQSVHDAAAVQAAWDAVRKAKGEVMP